jgi:threonine/homoserine/homoserine lactone efflux protein
VLRNSLAGGIRAGVETAVGVNAGSVVYGLLTAFGLTVLLHRSPMAWTILRTGGSAYLAWLGLKSLRHALRGGAALAAAPGNAGRRPLARNLREGFVTNMLNPSIAAFYLVVVPQFVPRGAAVIASVLTLTIVHVSVAATWHVTWATAGGALSRTLGQGGPRRVIEAVTGTVLLAFAAIVALST